MSNDYKSPAFKKLLDSLQQQSWELELIISGFAIFGLFTAYEPLKTEMLNAENSQQIYRFVINLVLFLACSILLFNLLLHVVLRGLWIGALGLRYVSGDIEFDKLRYTDKFINYLKKKIVSFDRYIANLENYCSVLFAVSFLLIFYVLALTIIIILVALIGNFVVDNETLPSWISGYLGPGLMVFLGFGMLLTFIDFITQGLLKRNKWVAKVYFPIYWIFSLLTLSFLYRPLVYNFLDHKFGKRIIFLLTPIYFGILTLTGLEYRNSNYVDPSLNSSSFFANKENYRDMVVEGKEFPAQISIPSKVISTPYLHVFISFSERIEDRIFNFNNSLKPEKDLRGLVSSNIQFNSNWFDESEKKDSLRQAYLKTFNEIYSFRIDTLEYYGDFIFTNDKANNLGFESYLNIKGLQEGKHLLRLKRKEKQKDTFITTIRGTIPFWYYKD